VVLATLENVAVEVAGMPRETIDLGIDEEGLVIGPYGTLAWEGSQISVESRAADTCVLRVRTTTGADATFDIPADSLGGSLSAPAFAKWLQRGAAHSGATIVRGQASA
jgi:hypothetical protein